MNKSMARMSGFFIWFLALVGFWQVLGKGGDALRTKVQSY
jgi:hypothetical protein